MALSMSDGKLIIIMVLTDLIFILLWIFKILFRFFIFKFEKKHKNFKNFFSNLLNLSLLYLIKFYTENSSIKCYENIFSKDTLINF